MHIKDIYDDLPIGVCIIRRDRKDMQVLYANMIMRTLLGGKHEHEVHGKAFKGIWAKENSTDIQTLIKKLKAPKAPKSFVLSVIDKKTKKDRWIKMDITRDLWEGQDCFTFWATDISANKAAEKRLQSAVEEAGAAAEVKSNFLATMSHEIRTPMQSIYGLLELIADEKPSANIKSMVNTAQESASGLLEILDDVLDFAKMDADKMELDFFEVPVRTLVRGILEALSVKIHGKNVKLIDDIDKNVPFVVIGDPKRLRQIIMNLIGNALKFTNKGKVSIRVTSKTKKIKTKKGRIALRFEVTDTGIGMPKKVANSLFSAFTQADNSTSRKYGGTGLGLSISKKLVDMMGGEIGVKSIEGKGSTFWFEIPTEEVSTDSSTLELPDLEGISVLSVEDHPQGAKEIKNSLRSMGAVVESCPTYKEGKALAKRRPFDVAVIDQGLPDGLGIDLIKEISKIRSDMGFIMYTVRDDSGLQHSLQALGVSYLTKPASRAGLGEAVQDAASKVQMMDTNRPRRILIAEDTASVRDVLKRQLTRLNVDVDFTENGKAALKAFKTGKYGLLLTDLHMPEMDGYDLVKAIRKGEKKDKEHFPVIVLTADVQMAQRDVYLREGFDECLLKPVSLAQFKRLLLRWGMMDPDGKLEKKNNKKSASSKTPKLISIDIKAIKKQMGAFDTMAIEMLQLFADMTRPLLVSIETAHQNKDYAAMAEAAHSLKGAAYSACCTALGDLAAELQILGENGKSDGALVRATRHEFNKAVKEIKSLKA